MKHLLTAITILTLGLGASFAADQSTTYPLKTCVVSGEKLGEMGKPFVFEYEGKSIELCCKSCKKKFDADPAKYMKVYDSAISKGAGKTSAPVGSEMPMNGSCCH